MAELQPLQDEPPRRKRKDEGSSDTGVLIAGGAAVVATMALIAAFASSKKKRKPKPGPKPGPGSVPGLGLGNGPDKEPGPGVDLGGAGPVLDFQPGELAGVFSLSTANDTWCGSPYIPRATSDYGDDILEVGGGGLVWGWTPPGRLELAVKYGKRLIADVESRASTKAKPSAGWEGDEIVQVRGLAPRVHGVTSHGFVLNKLKPVLQELGKAGCVAYPQIYDTDRSTPKNPGGARGFLRQCIDSYKAAGFERIVPLLGASAGVNIMTEWVDECRVLGVPFMLWSAQSLAGYNIDCEVAL